MKILAAGGWMPAFALCLLWAVRAGAGHSVLIWPVDPVITENSQGAELWVQNRGDATTLLQVRVYAWRQTAGREQYATQQDIQPLPTMIRLESGQKRLIRLIKRLPPPANRERAYRVLLDEIPTPYGHPDEKSHALNFQMRYSIPLFAYGRQSSPDSGMPILSWRMVMESGNPYLEITNGGPVHARLSKTRLGNDTLTDGLLGYVLAGSSLRWPLKNKVSPQAWLETSLDNRNTVWRSMADVH
ncbi:fimbrial biogenesis chaperone [Sodalis ligni]|jgi:fimbrial chaperone protein|uniref:Fimbrial chaperone protein n=1 Tax=Sodalis ligni TaxID=2697027 RepID=A0A4R1NKH7_9GAMM|nr:molecular chaperone [Sodalis ligni]TCL05286.1 fimbrial chaperone protein [Sodalis ligni]